MACNSKLKNSHYKSAQNAYNNTTQAFVAAGTPVNVLGILNTDTGCSIDTATAGFIVSSSGLYRISYDVVFTADGAGTAALRLLKDTAALPCAVAQVTTAANSIYTLHADYCNVASKHGVSTPEFYAEMAKAFLFDKDAKSPKDKMPAYYYGIVAVE